MAADKGWPEPGEEGFVHNDGTPQSEQQLADNKRAAELRAEAGSSVHGAPSQAREEVAADAGGSRKAATAEQSKPTAKR